MRYIDRSLHEPPEVLVAAARKGQLELAAARAWFADPDPKTKEPSFAAYKDIEVKAKLEAMFHGKCAYCETRYSVTQPMDVEHHRPKGRVAEDPAHPGYWWLAMCWENLLPSCIDCNRQRAQLIVATEQSLEALAASSRPLPAFTGKKDSFPIGADGMRAQAEAVTFDDEHALLLDPCRDQPSDFISFSFEPGMPQGVALPIGDEHQRTRGAVSIQIYGLNRLQLIQERTRTLRHLEFLEDLVVALSQSIEELEDAMSGKPLEGAAGIARTSARLRLLRDQILTEIATLCADDMPYSAMTRAWLAAFRARLSTPT